MKNISKLLLTIMIAILLTTGCGKKEKEENVKNTAYTFVYEDKEFILGDVFTEDKYGKAIDYSEVASCAFEGLDKTYTYEHFVVTTYPSGNTDKIMSIYFNDSEISTTEGIKIGDSINDLTTKYGNEYEEEDNLYTYTLGKTHIKFIHENDIITSIEYTYDA